MEFLKINSNFVFSFLDSVPLSMLFLNTDLSIFFTNKYFNETLKISDSSIIGLPFSDLSSFDISSFVADKENFEKYQQITLSFNKNLSKTFLLSVTTLTIIMNHEKDTRDLYVLIFQDPQADEIDQTKFQKWIQSTKSNISLIIYTFHSGIGPVPLHVINDSMFARENTPTDFSIAKIGYYLMTAIGQGQTQSTGLFGPLPVPGVEYENFNAIIYALHISDKEQTDIRTNKTRYTLVTLVYPKIYEHLLLNRRRIRSIILNYFQVKDISQLSKELVNKAYDELLFSEEGKFLPTTSKSRKRRKSRRKVNTRLLESRLDEITDLHNRIRDIYDLDRAIEEISTTIEKCVDFKLLAIFGVDKFSNELFILKTKGYYDYKIKSIRLDISNNNSVATRVAQSLKKMIINDVSKIDFYLSIDPSIKSNLAVPIKIKDELLGVIIVESDIKEIFSEDDATLLELLSEITASTINQHRNEIIGHDLNVLMNRLMVIDDFDEAVEEIARFAEILLNFEIFCVLDMTEEDVKFLAHRGYDSEKNIPKFKRTNKDFFVCHSFLTKEPIYIDNLKDHPSIPYYEINKKVSSEYCIPIIINDEVLSVINVESTRPLDRNEIVIFEALANYTKLLYKIYRK